MSLNYLRPMTPFGAEVIDLNIQTISDEDVDLLRGALAEQGVIVMRNQAATDGDFVAFLKRLGHLTFTVGETPVPDCPALNLVTNVGRTRPPQSVFHTDTSYIARPPAYTALRAVTLPQSGGETLFVNQYWAYETLPAAVKDALASARVLHVVSGLTLDDAQAKQCWHPLFRQHPISGRMALFLSTPKRCQVIADVNLTQLKGGHLGSTPSTKSTDTPVEPKLGQRIIRLLYQHSIRHYRIYRHHWRPCDIVIWDDRCTMHRADHSQVVGDRVLHRGLVLDSEPPKA